jgi:hypothetical protein
LYRRSQLSTAETGGRQLGARSSVLERATLVSLTDHQSVHEPAPPNLWTIKWRIYAVESVRLVRSRNMSTAAEPNQVSMAETAPLASTSSSDKLLSRIAILLFY